MTTRAVRRIASSLLIAFVLAGCGKDDDTPLPAPEPPTTQAAAMRAGLDGLFRGHAYLLGLATENALTVQAKAYEGAAEALDENALALGDRFETAYGSTQEKAFLTAWRPLTQTLVAYGAVKARKRPLTQIEKAFQKIEAAMSSFATRLSPLVSPRGLQTRTRDFIVAMRAVVDAQVVKDYAKADAALRGAGDAAGEIATMLARAFADDVPSMFPGDPRSAASSYRSSLDAFLVADTYLAGAVTENLATGQTAPREGAKKALAANTGAFAKAVAATYGPTSEQAFSPVWKRQTDLLFAFAGNTKDKTKRAKALADLKQYAADFGSFMSGLNAQLTAAQMTGLMQAHIDIMVTAVDAQVRGDLKGADSALRKAAGQAEALGAALAAATVTVFPARFRVAATG